MKAIFMAICLMLTSIAQAGTFDLSPKPVKPKLTREVVTQEAATKVIDKLDDITVVVDETQDKVEYYKEWIVYLFGATGLTLGGILSRIGYLFYQTKHGKLFIKHVKNTSEDISDDIINSIENLTELESGEILRARLQDVQAKLLEIAEAKLPPKPPQRRI